MPAAGVAIVRELTDDIAIKVKRPTEQTIVLRRGTLTIVDMVALRKLARSRDYFYSLKH
jgi:hypothetical protein